MTDANYMYVDDCRHRGQDHEWTEQTVDGEFDGYGAGVMKQRSCHKCLTIEYAHFTGNDGRVVDIDGMLKPYGLRQ